jgi:hypothetical protein
MPRRFVAPLLFALAATAAPAFAGATNFVVTDISGPFRYVLDGQIRPVLTLQRGTAYTFQLNQASFHPFVLTASGSGGGATVPFTQGVVSTGNCCGATLTFTPSATTPNTLFYVCTVHTGMGNQINIIDAPPPPCPGDTNGDRQVNGADLSVLLAQFGTAVTPGTGADFNNDGQVNGADLSVLLSNFGSAC